MRNSARLLSSRCIDGDDDDRYDRRALRAACESAPVNVSTPLLYRRSKRHEQNRRGQTARDRQGAGQSKQPAIAPQAADPNARTKACDLTERAARPTTQRGCQLLRRVVSSSGDAGDECDGIDTKCVLSAMIRSAA
jgi:hypothetical protein